MVWWWVLGGCGAGPASEPQVPAEPLPPLTVDPGDPTAAVGPIPCEHVHVVQIVNQDTVDHRVDALSFTATEGAVRLEPTDVELPKLIRAGRSMDVPLRSEGLEPGPTRGVLRIVSDVGSFEAEITGERTWGEPRSKVTVVPEPPVDVVLAVDQSGNMAQDYAAAFADGVGAWLDALSAVADWRLILVHEEDACSDGPVYEEGDRGVAAALGADAFSGPGHPYDERLLELASKALAENAPTECNGSFQRDGAQLHVVVVSDEPEQSGRAASFWVNDFYAYADTVVVSGLVDAGGRCNGGDGGYDDAIDATNGVSIDLCADDWDLSRLADGLAFVPLQIELAGGAVEPSIAATVDGRPVDTTWDADAGLLTVTEQLPPGTEVTVSWAVPAVCADD